MVGICFTQVVADVGLEACQAYDHVGKHVLARLSWKFVRGHSLSKRARTLSSRRA